MMATSMSIPATNLTTLTIPLSSKPFPLFSHKPITPLFPTPLLFPSLNSPTHLSKRPFITLRPSTAAAAADALETSAADPQPADEETGEKEVRVAVKGLEKPRLVLRFIWMEKNIGVALDQVIPGHGTIPLSPYYWWPRKDAWEELKAKLEEKPWISQKRMIILLNQATDIINLWQQSGAAAL